MDISKIQEKYKNGEYTDHTEVPRQLSDGYVFDENLSVKKNRELVEEHNRRVIQLRAEHRENNAALEKKMREDVIGYIVETYNLNDKQARIVEAYTYREKHSSAYDYFCYIDEFAEFAENIAESN